MDVTENLESRKSFAVITLAASCVILALFIFMPGVSLAADPGSEKVCLGKPNAEELAIIVKFNKDLASDKGWAKSVSSASVDINNDGKRDIVYSDSTRRGSCGYSWAVLLNDGRGAYRQKELVVCEGDCIIFLKDMKNGFRLVKTGNDILGVNDPRSDEGGLYSRVSTNRPASPRRVEPSVNNAPMQAPSSAGGGRWPFTSTRVINESDIIGLSRTDLEIMRNEIYARHGRSFNKRSLQSYFDNQSWYRRNPYFRDSDLSDIENKNVLFIKRYEL